MPAATPASPSTKPKPMRHRGNPVRSVFRHDYLPRPLDYFASENIQLNGRGAWRDAICPFHKDSKPSMRIRFETGAFRCMVCGVHGGDVLAFHQFKYGITFKVAARLLGAWVVAR